MIPGERDCPPGHAPPAGQASRVALINMPFASSRRPSIQVGLLQAILEANGVSATSLYFNLELGASIGWERYESLCHARDILFGEWLFARAAFLEHAPDPGPYVEHYAKEIDAICAELCCDVSYLLSLREHLLPAFVDSCVEQTDWLRFGIVGFSSIFEQNCAALALARRLKDRFPTLAIVFGGANFEDEMGIEYLRAIPWIDYAVIGEGDEVFPKLVKLVLAGENSGVVLGVATRTLEGAIRFAGRAAQVTNLDALPEPEYGEYFETAARLLLPPLVRGQIVRVPIETARGCWWGAKHHCIFCGLNGLGMTFRSKSPARVLSSLDELARRHATYAFLSVDNILDHRYIGAVFEPIARQRKDYTFFFEVKANLSQDQLRKLARAGVCILQPGIESLNTHVLQLMRKGTTALQNVNFLKWARYYGIVATWNLLLGFPGETAADYALQVEIMRHIPHLCPPGYVGRIRLDRFSPNFVDSSARGFHGVRPIPAYSAIYPDTIDHRAIAYFFAYSAAEALPDEAFSAVMHAVHQWQHEWGRPDTPFLVFQRGAGCLTVTDGRCRTSPPRISSFGELEATVYETCTPSPCSASRVLDLLRLQGIDTSAGAVDHILSEFTHSGLMLKEVGHYLSLALPVNPNW